MQRVRRLEFPWGYCAMGNLGGLFCVYASLTCLLILATHLCQNLVRGVDKTCEE